jgi:protocatechuate 3,4-dioxygenase beta subunit
MRLVLFVFCCSLPLYAQASPGTPEKGVLAGKVLNSVTGEPVRKAQIALIGKPGTTEGGSAVTDAAGRFEFTGLGPGSYRVAAFREGYDSPSGPTTSSKLPHVTLTSGEEKRDFVIRLTPLGAITGRILDEDGDPIRQIEVQTMVYRYTAAGRQLMSRGNAMSNDLGEYRIYDVRPGRYYLKAGTMGMMGGGALRESYGASYYPGTPDSAAAAAIEVGGGQTLEGIDLTLRPMKIANIRGRVMNRGGNNLTVGLLKFTEDGGSASNSTGVNDPDGKFELRGVSPGSYFLTAQCTVGGQPYSAHVPIQVGAADLEGLDLHLMPPMEISGQVRIEGKTADKLSTLNVVLENGGRMNMPGDGTRDDGTFVMHGLEPSVYQISVTDPPDLYLKAVRWADRDVMQSGLDLTQGAGESKLVVVMSANGGQIEGEVSDDQSAAVADGTVALIPSSGTPSKSLCRFAQTGANGRFHMQAIAPGSYKLFAWQEVDPNQVMYDPDFLKPFDSQAQSVEISEGSQKSVQLTLIKQ